MIMMVNRRESNCLQIATTKNITIIIIIIIIIIKTERKMNKQKL